MNTEEISCTAAYYKEDIGKADLIEYYNDDYDFLCRQSRCNDFIYYQKRYLYKIRPDVELIKISDKVSLNKKIC